MFSPYVLFPRPSAVPLLLARKFNDVAVVFAALGSVVFRLRYLRLLSSTGRGSFRHPMAPPTPVQHIAIFRPVCLSHCSHSIYSIFSWADGP